MIRAGTKVSAIVDGRRITGRVIGPDPDGRIEIAYPCSPHMTRNEGLAYMRREDLEVVR